MGTVAKWMFVGARSVIGAFALLSLLLGEQWVRGWLRSLLTNWQDLVHSLAVRLPFHLSWLTERYLVFVAVLIGTYATGFFVDEQNIFGLSSHDDETGSPVLPHPRIFFLAILLGNLLIYGAAIQLFGDSSSFADLANRSWYAGKYMALYVAVSLILLTLSAWVLNPRATFMMIGAAAALLLVNYSLQFAHFLPQPPQ